MFDFDVVTGPAQPPHCPLAAEIAAEIAGQSGALAVPESLPQPASPGAGAAGRRPDRHPIMEEKRRS
ncbi:hypothetical protein [Azospirillum sp. B510]|uniref:hypothetical protein n=1 Tax=Azospirillum sp. (strain B510) TaxID=137722 RepID=UPI00030C2673|nr:hypothetical protein [Azospirillum sp. B510]